MENYPAERLNKTCAGPCEIAIIPNCDHFFAFARRESGVKIVTDWLKER